MRSFERRRDDRGAAAVEFALLFPIFMILVMGTINGGMAFSRQINVTQAAREASRYGSSYDIHGIGGGGSLAARTATWLTAVDNAARESAGNAANPIGGYDYRCVAIVRLDGAGAVDNTVSTHMENGGAATTGACPTTTPADIPGATYVQVVLSRDVQFFVLFINPKLHLDSVSVTPYEGKLE